MQLSTRQNLIVDYLKKGFFIEKGEDFFLVINDQHFEVMILKEITVKSMVLKKIIFESAGKFYLKTL